MKKTIYISLIILVFAGCKKNNENFIINGRVYTVPEFENYIGPIDFEEDVSISIENTNFNTKTVNGEFLFNDVSEGKYNLLFAKSNYSDLKYFNYQSKIETKFLHHSEPSYFYLFEKSSTIVQQDLTYEIDGEEIHFGAHINPPSSIYADSIRYFFLFINDSKNVTYNNYLYSSSQASVGLFQYSEQSVDIDSLYSNIPDFDPQKTYYAVAYGASISRYNAKAKYLDKDKNIWIYMGLNDTPSNIVSFSIDSKQ